MYTGVGSRPLVGRHALGVACVCDGDWLMFLLLLFEQCCMQWVTLSSTELEMSFAEREEWFIVLYASTFA